MSTKIKFSLLVVITTLAAGCGGSEKTHEIRVKTVTKTHVDDAGIERKVVTTTVTESGKFVDPGPLNLTDPVIDDSKPDVKKYEPLPVPKFEPADISHAKPSKIEQPAPKKFKVLVPESRR